MLVRGRGAHALRRRKRRAEGTGTPSEHRDGANQRINVSGLEDGILLRSHGPQPQRRTPHPHL